MHVGDRHKDRDLEDLALEDLWFESLLDSHDAAVARAYDSALHTDSVAMRATEEVDNESEDDSGHYTNGYSYRSRQEHPSADVESQENSDRKEDSSIAFSVQFHF